MRWDALQEIRILFRIIWLYWNGCFLLFAIIVFPSRIKNCRLTLLEFYVKKSWNVMVNYRYAIL